MLFRLIKFLFFAAIVLLIGQIRVGQQTLAERFQNIVVRAGQAGGERLMRNRALAGLSDSFLGHWLHGISPPALPVRPQQAEMALDKEETEADEFSSSDRESILRVLQEKEGRP